VITAERLGVVSRLLRADDLAFKRLWPSLEFVCTWTTAICSAHLSGIRTYLADIDVIDAIYSATEGWVTVPVADIGASPVHPGAHIFEFIEAGQDISKEHLLPPWALKPGVRYELFLTTAMGMVRYRLCDVVTCTGFFNRAPVIEFSHKSASIISLGLVSVSESELAESLQAAGIVLARHWRVGPGRAGNGLVLYVDRDPPNLDAQLARADAHLRALNINYRIYAGNRTIEPLSHAVLPPSHRLWEQGAHHAQSKPVLLLQTCPE
jgi:hypothetical protein